MDFFYQLVELNVQYLSQLLLPHVRSRSAISLAEELEDACIRRAGAIVGLDEDQLNSMQLSTVSGDARIVKAYQTVVDDAVTALGGVAHAQHAEDEADEEVVELAAGTDGTASASSRRPRGGAPYPPLPPPSVTAAVARSYADVWVRVNSVSRQGAITAGELLEALVPAASMGKPVPPVLASPDAAPASLPASLSTGAGAGGSAAGALLEGSNFLLSVADPASLLARVEACVLTGRVSLSVVDAVYGGHPIPAAELVLTEGRPRLVNAYGIVVGAGASGTGGLKVDLGLDKESYAMAVAASAAVAPSGGAKGGGAKKGGAVGGKAAKGKAGGAAKRSGAAAGLPGAPLPGLSHGLPFSASLPALPSALQSGPAVNSSASGFFGPSASAVFGAPPPPPAPAPFIVTAAAGPALSDPAVKRARVDPELLDGAAGGGWGTSSGLGLGLDLGGDDGGGDDDDLFGSGGLASDAFAPPPPPPPPQSSSSGPAPNAFPGFGGVSASTVGLDFESGLGGGSYLGSSGVAASAPPPWAHFGAAMQATAVAAPAAAAPGAGGGGYSIGLSLDDDEGGGGDDDMFG